MASQDLKLVISGDAKSAQRALKETGSAVDGLGKKIKNSSAEVEVSQTRFEKFKDTIGPKLKAAVKVGSMAIVAAGGLAIKSAVEYESAFAGVRKTVDATEEQFQRLSSGVRRMSKEIPSSATEIAKVMEVAGQLGIQTDSLEKFTRVIIDLGNATNMVGEEGALQLAKFANITKMSQKDFDRLGSVIVDLGNKTATTERDIVNMGMRLAGAGKQIGMSEAQIMGMAAALSSVGVEAEMGGSAFSRLMVNMQLAVETGNKDLGNFAKVAGVTTTKFKQAFREDAGKAIAMFVDGLADTDKKGVSAIKVLDDMGISEVRLRDAILRSSGAQGLMNKTLDIGSAGWRENNALTEEASKRYKTVAARWQIFKNRIVDVGVTIGDRILPVINKLFDAFESDSFRKVSEEFNRINEAISDYLMPKLSSLWSVFKDDLIPTVGEFWDKHLSPLAEVLGKALVGAIGLAADTLKVLTSAVSWVVKEMNEGNPVIWSLAGAFGGLAAAMALGAAFDAIKVGFATLRLITIPSTMASFTAFKALLMTPMVMPAIAIGAAIASLVAVINKVKEAHDAVNDAKLAMANTNAEIAKTNAAMKKARQDGKISQAAYDKYVSNMARADAEFNRKQNEMKSSGLSGWIFGSMMGRASGGPVKANQPYLVGENPDGSINRTTELFVPSSSGHIMNSGDLQRALSTSGGGSTVYNQTVNLTLAVEPKSDFGYSDAVNMIQQINTVLKSQGLKLDQMGAVR